MEGVGCRPYLPSDRRAASRRDAASCGGVTLASGAVYWLNAAPQVARACACMQTHVRAHAHTKHTTLAHARAAHNKVHALMTVAHIHTRNLSPYNTNHKQSNQI